MYALFLSTSGFCVDQAEDAGDALGHLAARCPDVAVIDIALPGTDGLELCRQIRQRAPAPTPVLIAITGLCPDRSLDERAREAGFDTLLFKPCTPDVLVAAVQRACVRSTRLGEQSRALFTRVQDTIDHSVRTLEESATQRQQAQQLRRPLA